MPRRVQLPDGTIAEFPDDFSDDQITEVIQNSDLSSRQAEGGQSPDGTALPLGGDPGAGPTLDPNFSRNFTDDPDDPLRTVPLEIGGVTIPRELREALLQGRDIEDPREKLLLAARVGGRIAAGAPDPEGAPSSIQRVALGDPEVLTTFFRGLGTGIFGLGDFAGAAGVKFSEPNLSFGEALAFQREFRRAKEENLPLASVAGEVTGAIFSGGAFIKLARQAFSGTRVAPVIEKATVFTKAGGFKGFVANSGRATLAGGTAGAITEGISEGEPLQGLAVGVIAGPAGVGIAKAAQLGLPAARRFLLDPASKGIRILAKQLGKSADEMSLRFLRFQAATGRKPTMADIVNDEAAAELEAMIIRHQSAATIAREGAEAASARRAAEFAEDIPAGRVTTTQRAQTAARGRVGDIQFGAARGDQFKFTARQVQDLLSDPDVRGAMPASLRRRFDEVLNQVKPGQPATFAGVDVLDLRQALGDRAKSATGADFIFKDLVNELDAIAGLQSENYALALDRFAARSQRIEGVGLGRSVVKQKTSETEALAASVESPDLGAGIRVGTRSELVDVAREGSEQAARLARSLADDTGLLARLRAVLPAREVKRLQELGIIIARSARNVGNLGPAIKAEQNVANEIIERSTKVAAVSSGAGGAFRANTVATELKNLLPGRSKRTLESIARDLFDPEKTGEALDAMRRLGLSEARIYDLFIGAMAAGNIAANVVDSGGSQ